MCVLSIHKDGMILTGDSVDTKDKCSVREEIVRGASLEKVTCSLITKRPAIRDHGNRRRVSEQGHVARRSRN